MHLYSQCYHQRTDTSCLCLFRNTRIFQAHHLSCSVKNFLTNRFHDSTIGKLLSIKMKIIPEKYWKKWKHNSIIRLRSREKSSCLINLQFRIHFLLHSFLIDIFDSANVEIISKYEDLLLLLFTRHYKSSRVYVQREYKMVAM